jgi:two-component system response regulator MtrA
MIDDRREKPRRILVVDDDPGILKAMEGLLHRSGFETIACATGADAMDKAAADVHAAVVDIHLPDMSGLALSQKLRGEMGIGWPIVILSGDTSIETLRELPNAGATHFFSKPVNTGLLLSRLREWTDGR